MLIIGLGLGLKVNILDNVLGLGFTSLALA